MFRICSRCGMSKLLEEFRVDSRAPLGRRYGCRDCDKEKAIVKYHDDLEAARAKGRKSTADRRARNPDFFRDYDRQYYAYNPEPAKARTKQWRKENPDRKKGNELRRQSLKRGFEYESGITVESLVAQYGTLCCICEEEMLFEWPGGYHPLYRTFEHIKPISKGGAHKEGNVKLAHWVCNTRKNDKWEETSEQES